MFICECGREFKRKEDLSNHKNKCGNIFIHMGYECFIGKDGEQIFVHRYKMEQKLGRKLESHEIVHHKDENKRNNDPDNLEVLTNSDHSSLHWTNDRKKIMSKVKTDNWKNINGVKLNPNLVIEIRQRLLDKRETQTHLSKEYGVSCRTIRDIRDRKTWKTI
jgi:hypothetical protein